MPNKIHSDNGTSFVNGIMKELTKRCGIIHTTSTPYHSQGNAICERLNRNVLNMIGTLSATEKRSWQKHTDYLTYAYNTTIHSSTVFSPFYLVFGRNPKLIGDCIIGVNFNHACKLTVDKFLVNL